MQAQTVTMDSLNGQFAAHDAARDPVFRETYPIQTIEEMEQAYPDQWVAVAATAVANSIHGIAAGRVIAAAASVAEIDALIQPILERYPGIGISHCCFGYYGVPED